MKTILAALLFLGVFAHSFAQTASTEATHITGGILQSIDNAAVTSAGDRFLIQRTDAHASITLVFTGSQAVGVEFENKQWWILPISAAGVRIEGNQGLWILPVDAASKDRSWFIQLSTGDLSAEKTESGLKVTVNADRATLTASEARPHSDIFGHRFSFHIDGGADLENALAGFYWGTILPSVVEKTMAAKFPYHDGYVLSTLNITSYAGSYPAVDHEFQIKARLAIGSDADLDVVRRMIELQFRLMENDPERLYRAPTSVQPDGRREYHVRRNSQNNHVNAAMFPLTGDIEVIEEAWNYYSATKNSAWLRANIENLEHAAGWILANTDQYGRVWSDVYYEDQVMKDGRETMAQAFAAHAFELLVAMEKQLGRPEKTARYTASSKQMAGALIAPLPMGYWDEQSHRFIDWVDRDGKPHDHIHLLANELPVLFGYATPAQSDAVRHLIEDNAAEFERFPSFVAANIAAYDKSEIGDGGPYDLCAAGRYWYWDAAFRASMKQNGLLLDQLKAVATEAAKNSYFMDERYDMDHFYYIDGKNSHGAKKYYEYPNVFAAVLIGKYLGLSIPADADVSVSPHSQGYGSVELDTPQYALYYSSNKDGFVLKNLSDKPRRYKVDLSALGSATVHYRLESRTTRGIVGARSTITLPAHGEARWILQQ
ncbi:glucosidase family protein [Occallatibacter riparius]|uniref:Glycogen debranching protein n=1 Tax=Occallatibacter riparius TaxID=1002689 RepID=A0A9J7BNN5_9BACT|nr:hypothetical protein [Occallatibacter riparius]UWZ84336.1 hypothetical protein MOP44_00025 [Occallatibacter riparius]